MAKDVFNGLDSLYLIAAEVEDLAEEAIIDLATDIHTKLMDSPPVGTPVDTGWARSNWQIETGKEPEGVIGSKENVDDSKALQDRDNLKNYKLTDGDIYIQNNVPYIGVLNQLGHSKQSPSFFVDKAVLDSVEKFNGG